MGCSRKGVLVAGLLGAGLLAYPALLSSGEPGDAAKSAKPDRWKQWRPLVGSWQGASEGEPGKGTVRLEVSFVMGERFLRIGGTADYKKGAGGEHHEDFGFVSHDSSRKTKVFRQFHAEGFVNHYVLTSDPNGGEFIELTSESCENAPPGWKARERYTVKGDALEHTFELAPPDKPFAVYTRAKLSRVRKD
jgi:hypothetical protein